MGRTRQYATASARQAAYRQRMKTTTVWVNREPFEQMLHATNTLYSAIGRASAQGHQLARDLSRATPEATLSATVAWVVRYLQTEKLLEDALLDTEATTKRQTC